MKRILSLVLVFVMMFALCAVNVNAEEYTEVDVYVNGKKLDTPQSAIILWGRTMVPARAICEALGCTVTWNGASQTVRIESPVTVVSAQINNYKLSKMDKGNSTNIQEVLLDVPPILFNDSTLLPARAIAEAFYADVQWNNDKRCVEITMEYDYIGQFNDGLAKVEKEGKVGFINLAREVVIPLSYDDAGSFSEGVAAVCKRGKYGYIDKTGGIVIEHKYLDAGPFSQGLAAVKMTDEKWYYIDLQGTLKLKGKYEVAEPFNSEGIAKVGKGSKWGYVNTEGKTIVPISYDELGEFKYGIAKVKNSEKYGYVNDKGNVIVPVKYDWVGEFKNGFVIVEKYGKVGFISEDGQIVIDCIYDDADNFEDGKARVVEGSEVYYIDTKGKKIN